MKACKLDQCSNLNILTTVHLDQAYSIDEYSLIQSEFRQTGYRINDAKLRVTKVLDRKSILKFDFLSDYLSFKKPN